MQLTAVQDRQPRHAASWLLGAVRTTAAFLPPGGPATKAQVRALRDHALREFSSAPWLGSTGYRLVGIGGAVRNLATASLDLHGHPEVGGAQGVSVDRDTLDELIEEMRRRPSADRARLRGIKPSRADIILAGAVVIATALEACGAEALESTEYGLREGVLLAEQIGDAAGRRSSSAPVTQPPLVDDVRTRGRREPGPPLRHGRRARRARHACSRSRSSISSSALELQDDDPHERELLWAACQLHDIGMRLDYDDHHRHARYILTSNGLPGLLTRRDGDHRPGRPLPPARQPVAGGVRAALASGDTGRLLRITTLLRLAEGLERGRDGAVANVSVTQPRRRRRASRSASQREAQVPRWAAARETELFERAYGTSLTVEVD